MEEVILSVNEEVPEWVDLGKHFKLLPVHPPFLADYQDLAEHEVG